MKKSALMFLSCSLLLIQSLCAAEKEIRLQAGEYQNSCEQVWNSSSCNACDSCCEPCSPFQFNLNLSGSLCAHVDWLFWRVRRSGLDYCERFESIEGGAILSGYSTIRPQYHSGFRVGLGVCSLCSNFGLDVLYTRYCDQENDKFSSLILACPRTHPEFFGSSFSAAKCKYDIDYNVVDLLVSSCNTIDCGYCIKPFFGVRLGFIEEKMRTTLISRGAEPFWKINEKLKTNAYGLIIGFENTKNIWTGCFDLNFYTRLSVSFLVDKVKKEHKELLELPDVTLVNAHLSDYEMISSRELAVGFEGVLYQCGCRYLKVMLGYEFHQWLNYPDFINFSNDSNLSTQSRNLASLGLDGLYLRFTGCF